MANIIAVIWDCDKTLINGYMQDPIFKKYNVDAHDFWDEVNKSSNERRKCLLTTKLIQSTAYKLSISLSAQDLLN